MISASDTIAYVSSSFAYRNHASDYSAALSAANQQYQWLPLRQVGIGVNDIGFRQSVVAVERLRTYGGRVLGLAQHLTRYRRTLDCLGIALPLDQSEMQQRIGDLVTKNRPWCEQEIDFGITMLATPGEDASTVTEIIHFNPLDHNKIARQRTHGQPVVITSVRQPSEACWPRDIKVRCRLHYHLADHQARQVSPSGIGVLVDEDGSVTETSVANLAMVIGGEILSPPTTQVLPGITQHLIQRLALESGLTWRHQTIPPAQLRGADEVLLMGTDGGIWYANRVDEQPICQAQPGSIYQQLRHAFDHHVGTVCETP